MFGSIIRGVAIVVIATYVIRAFDEYTAKKAEEKKAN